MTRTQGRMRHVYYVVRLGLGTSAEIELPTGFGRLNAEQTCSHALYGAYITGLAGFGSIFSRKLRTCARTSSVLPARGG